MSKRYCTMPKIPWFRDWFEGKFGDLCEAHDAEYVAIEDQESKYWSDFKFACKIAQRGYFWFAIGALLLVSLPWVGKALESKK